MTNYSFRIPKLTIYKDVDFFSNELCTGIKYLLTKSGKAKAGSLLLAIVWLSPDLEY
jgi:hypothetical protein